MFLHPKSFVAARDLLEAEVRLSVVSILPYGLGGRESGVDNGGMEEDNLIDDLSDDDFLELT
jgi:hypothetical protein